MSELPPEIGQLTNLSYLYLQSNQLRELPPEIRQLTKLNILDLRGNSLPIPPEILEKIYEPATILNYYFAEKKKPLNEVKMLLVGQGSVGKTSLMKRLLDNHYNPQENQTEEINIRDWKLEINDQTIKVNVWDFGGQEIMDATHQFFLTERSLYLLVLDARLGEEENRLEYWLKIINSHSNSSPVIVIGNKIDQHTLDIDRKGLKDKYPKIITFLETSCQNNQGIDQVKKTIIKVINDNLNHVYDLLPLTWFNVKAKLETLKKQGLDYTEYSEYTKICRLETITEDKEQKLLIYLLHHLGVILNFQDDPRLNSNNVLNPEWVTNAVYKIINNRDLIIEDKGVLSLNKLTDILNRQRYPCQKHLFIIDMMEKFELCFEMDSDKKYLIPDIIPKEEPETGEWDNSLCFQYHYPVYINSIISRFIVRSKDYIAKNTYWRTGVVLQNKEGNKALIKADREDKTIFIKVKGNENTKRSFLSIIRSEFEVIHKSLPGLEPEIKEYIALPQDETKPISYRYLLQLEQAGKETFLPEGYDQDVNVSNLLNGFESESRRQKRQSELYKDIHINIHQNQHNTMSNNNINQSHSGSGDNIGHDKTSLNINPSSFSDTQPTKDNTKALNFNTTWVIIGSIVALIGIIIGIITTFGIPSIKFEKLEPSQPSTSTNN
nr:COR domain-containing protein [Rippkaea orientalis]